MRSSLISIKLSVSGLKAGLARWRCTSRARRKVPRVGTKGKVRRAIRLVSKCRECKRFAVGPETRHSAAVHKRSARSAVALWGGVVNYHHNNPHGSGLDFSHSLSLLLCRSRRLYFSFVPLSRFFLRLRQQRWTVFQSATVYAIRGVYTRRWFYGNVNG